MKKYLAGILVLVMALTFSLVSCQENSDDPAVETTTPAPQTTPADNGDDAPCEHAYANACDADCNVCGATRTPAAHVYANACDADCNVCGATRTPAAHVYDHACDKTCNVCGATRTVGGHTYNADGVCSECGSEKPLVESNTGLEGWGTPFPY